MKEYLKDEDVNCEIDETEEKIVRICKAYRRGILTNDDFLSQVEGSIASMLYEFLPLHGYKFQFSTTSWIGFSEEYNLWKKGQTLKEEKGETWLFFDNLDGSVESLEITRRARVYGSIPPEQYVAASSQDVIQFYRILDRFNIPPDCFKPLPEGLQVPQMHVAHQYSEGCNYIVDYTCIDDGGLSREKEPVGKTFCLKNNIGLKAKVTIKACRSLYEQTHGGIDIDDYLPTAKYLAVGTIEGYSSDRERELTIRTDMNEQINKLGFFSDNDDYQARSEFPLWQEGYRIMQEENDYQRRIAREMSLSCVRRLDETVYKIISSNI